MAPALNEIRRSKEMASRGAETLLERSRAARMSAAPALLACLIAVLVATGCGGKTGVVTPPAEELPPQVVEVYPAANHTGVAYDVSEIWVRFAEPLDSSTVNSGNVFLKLDTRRHPVSIAWDSGTRRIVIHPQQPLRLADTYTVELGADLATAAGARLGSVYWWQFRVSGLRRLQHPLPASEATGESPFAPLSWDRTESSAGPVTYELYVGRDSAAVAARSIPPAARSGQSQYYLLGQAWQNGARYYWSVSCQNTALSEHQDGPVWTFETAPLGAPTDSIAIPAARWAYFTRSSGRSFCGTSTFASGTGTCLVAWDLRNIRPALRIAGARIKMTCTANLPPLSSIGNTSVPVVTEPCDFLGNEPSSPNFLAFSTNTGGPYFYYASSELTAHLAAMHNGLSSQHGYSIQSPRLQSYVAPPVLVLHYYR